jgi:Fe-S-cluster containining protein
MSNKFNLLDDNDPWFKEGLNFKCTECGKCCTGAPGFVWVTEEETKNISTYLNLSHEDFLEKYTFLVGNRRTLKDDPETYDCIFLKEKKCSIYSLRPKQCRTYPWWPSYLQSEEAWKRGALDCEGINSNAPKVPYENIKENLKKHLE